MLDQKYEEEKERKKRRNQRIIGAFLFGLFFTNLFLMVILPPLSNDTELKGKVIFFVPNHGTALVFLSNKIFTVYEGNYYVFDKNVQLGDDIQKESGSDTLFITKNQKNIC